LATAILQPVSKTESPNAMAEDQKLPFNSANRLRMVAQRLQQCGQQLGGNQPRSQIIARLLELDADLPAHQRQRHTLLFLNDANREVDHLERDLKLNCVPSTLYSKAVSWLRAPLFSVEGLTAATDPKSLFPAENILVLGWASLSTKQDQEEMNEQTIKEIADSILKLIDEISGARFSPTLAVFLLEKLNDALLAVRSYQLTGLEPLFWKFKYIATEVQARESEIKTEAASDPAKHQVLENFVKVWNGTHEQIQKVSNTITSVGAAAGTAALFLTYIGVMK
jgi:hypothetical protein